MKNYKRYIFHNCKNVVYHKDFSTNNVYEKHNINISTYIPPIIRKIINSIHVKFDNNYIICPFYNNLYNYQIGITETGKMNESTYDTIIRGINEECGLNDITWNKQDNYNYKQKNKNWFGVCIYNNNYKYKPQSVMNNNEDNILNKVAVIIHNTIFNLLQIFNNIKEGDIDSDEISGLGFISVYDCKQILNRF